MSAYVRVVISGVALSFLLTSPGAVAQDETWLARGVPDPGVVRAHDGSGYYIASTGDGIPLWHSTDLKHWERIGRIFDKDVPAWAAQLIPGAHNVWAPDLQYTHGRYYVYYSVSTFGSQRSVIGLATNRTLDPKHPDYQWEDHGLVLESFLDTSGYNAIDAALFVDRDQRGYLFWGSYWEGIRGAPVELPTGTLESTRPEGTAIAARRDRASTAIEGAYVIRRGDWYYLFVSWDNCCAGAESTYKVMVGRARRPLGPYVDADGRPMNEGGGTLVVMSNGRWRGTGHNSVLQTDRGDYLVHHAIDADAPRGGRVLQIRPLAWNDGWPAAGEPLTGPGDRTTSPLVGRWRHVVDGQDEYDIFLEPSGLIGGVPGEARWIREGDSLRLRWRDPNAPGGWWEDRATLDLDAKTYQGSNQNGTPIEGTMRDR
ncbi:Intracellular endo-alpha-(1-_5)-L-arabinanase [Maioricimonas rarisocia]|uniref:Intracellular endo-alpha-(1->5)-L-arabinanase n=1 Tax=Maioricimonas rarisocia TaxID=2528026 RepID=A0A517ZEP5_9PLAN|nr:arabinan endo-1,5-alpha-L-arabinosidase [Maioricimonas rarisocia]QDU40936.1 Intracellular endo-alpha-(1->5)-L-arabinanase [Maioricimonas rarisocia]